MNNSNGYRINTELCNLSASGILEVCDKVKKSDSLLNSECLSMDINDDVYETDCSSVNINKFDFYSIDDVSNKMLIDDGDSVNDDVANFAEIIVDNSNVSSSSGFFLNSTDNSPHFNVGGNKYTITHNGNLSAVDVCKDSRTNNENDSKNSPIMLTIRGKTCRSLQHLTDEQLKIVSQILRQESKNTSKCKSYRSTYVDQQRGTSVLYKVMKVDQSLVKEIPNKNFTIKMGRPSKCQIELQKSLKEEEENRDVIVARTRSGRLSKLPRHISQNYKQIKETYEQNTANSTDHNQSTVLSKDSDQTKQDGENKLLGPLGPNKRHFSSTSLCPTCGKVYLGYKRMAIHFEKYPDHRDEEFLNNLKNMRSIDYGDKDTSNFVLNNTDQTQSSSQITNGLNESIPVTSEPANKVKSTAKKKNSGCKNCKFNVSYKNASSMLKKILTLCDPNEVIKYAGPIVTSVMNMWELLVMRIKQLKNDKETFAEVLLKEVCLVLEKIKTLSCQLITPLLEEDNKENKLNKLKIEEVDILQHVLGVRPGLYVMLENENWLPNTNCVDNNLIKACRKRPAIKLDSNISGGYESVVADKNNSNFEAVGEHVSSKSSSNTAPMYSNPVQYDDLEDDNERNFIDILREMESTEKCAASDSTAAIATGSNNSASDISSNYPQSHFDSTASIQNCSDYSSALSCKVNNINNNNESVISANGNGMFYEVEVTDSIFENTFMSSSAAQNNIDSKISNTKHNNNDNNSNSNNSNNTNSNTNANGSSGNINSLVTISDLNTADYIMIDFNNKSFSPPSISTDDITSLPHFDTFASHTSNTSSIDIMNELALSLSNEEGSANKSSMKRSLNSNDFLNTLRHLDSSNDSIIQQLGTSINSNTSTDVLNHNESFRNCFTTNNHCHLDDDTLSSVDILDFSQSLNSNFHHSRSS